MQQMITPGCLVLFHAHAHQSNCSLHMMTMLHHLLLLMLILLLVYIPPLLLYFIVMYLDPKPFYPLFVEFDCSILY